MQYLQHIFSWLPSMWRRYHHHPLLFWSRILVIGIVGGWLAVMLWGGVTGSLGVLSVHGEVQPSRVGETVVALPPFGTITAPTHRAPVKLLVRVEAVHVDALVNLLSNAPSRDAAVAQIQLAAIKLARTLLLLTLGVAAAGGFVGGLLLGARRWAILVAMLSGVTGVAIPLLLMIVTFRPAAFATPVYRGELSRAPELLQTVQDGWRNYATLEKRIPVVVSRVLTFYRQLNTMAVAPMPPETDLIRVLHISDLHNNPLGLRFAQDLAREYHVDLVVFTGDATDLGHPLEAELLDRWKRFTVLVVVISGNHDSRAIMAKLAQLPRVTVLDNGKTVWRAGLTLMGFGDPAAQRAGVGSVDPTAQELRILQQQIQAKLAHAPAPDLLLVHNFRVAARLLGRAPVILTGHSHVPALHQRRDSIVINPGTTGAAGLRYFTGPRQPPYGAAVLHFSRGTRPTLQLVDYIALEEPAGNFSIRRQNIARQNTAATILAERSGTGHAIAP